MDVNLDDLKHLKQFENHACALLDPETKYYFCAGASSSSIPRGNEEALKKYRIQPRVLRDVSETDLSCEILKEKFPCPIGIAPTAIHSLAHKDAEIATALGSAKEGCIYIMSCVSSTTIEDVSKTLLKTLPSKSTLWMQVYISKDRSLTLDLLNRAETSGFSAIVVTVDSPVGGQFGTDFPRSLENRIKNRHPNLPSHSSLCSLLDSSLTFEDLKWLKQHTKLPVIVKGILCGGDAIEAVKCGASAVYVSNHGERHIHNVVSTIDVLEEVIKSVEGYGVDVYFDGGIRHGNDVFVAMAMGAKAVFVGRPIIWGLAVAGEEGVRRVLQILKEEFLSTMKLAGVKNVRNIQRSMIRKVS